jgi:hypothetical protein
MMIKHGINGGELTDQVLDGVCGGTSPDPAADFSEMGEMESLRLQMAMDRRSKVTSMLSNMFKKASDTSSAITQNLK